MAVVGEAYVVVRAVTNQVKDDIRKGFKGIDSVGDEAGRDIGRSFNRSLSNSINGGGGGGIVNTLANISRKFDGERKKVNSLIRKGFFFGPLISVAAGAIGSLITAFVPLLTILSSAAQASIALGGALASIGQGAITAVVAFRGVFKAFQLGKQAADEAAGANDRVRDALRRVEKAQIALRNVIDVQGPQMLADARDQAAAAEERAADALMSSERATRSYNQAQERSVRAIENLNKAREEAKERIQQLRFELEGGAISEKKARLEFEKARDSLQRVQDLPPNSRARQEAELAFAEADLNLRKAIDRNSDLTKEEEAATRAGVEGSAEVVSAKKDIENAIIGERDAQIAAAKAIRDAARARQEADQAAADAGAGGKVEKEIAERIAQAREQLEDAQRAAEAAKKSAGGASNDFQKALEELSPEAAKFVEYLLELEGVFKPLKAAAGRNLFGPLETSIDTMVNKFLPTLNPLFEETGGILGELAVGFSETATSATNLGNLEKVWQSNNVALGSLGRAGSSLYTILLAVFRAAGPLVERFAAWIEKISAAKAETLGTEEGVARLTEKFNNAGDIVATLGGIFRDLWEAFREVGSAAREEGGAVDIFLTRFGEAAAGFRSFAEGGVVAGEQGTRSLGQFLADATTNFFDFAAAINDALAALLRLSDNPAIGTVSNDISEKLIPKMEGIGTTLIEAAPSLTTFADQFLLLIQNLTETGSIETFFKTLTTALETVNAILGNESVKAIFDFLAPFKGATLAVGALGIAGKTFGGAFLGSLTLPFKGIKRLKDAVSGGGKGGIFSKLFKGSKDTRDELKKQEGVEKDKRSGLQKLRDAAAKVGVGFKKMRGASSGLRAGLGRMGGAIGGAITSFGKLAFAILTNPIFLIAAAIIGIGLLIYKFRDEIAEFFVKAWEYIKEKVQAFWDWFKEMVPKAIEGILTFFREFPDKIVDALVGFATTVVNFIREYHPIAILFRFVRDKWPEVRGWLREVGPKIVEALRDFTGKVLNFIRDNHPIAILFRFVKEKWPEVKTWFEERIDKIVGFFSGIKDKVKNAASNIWDGLKDGLETTLNFVRRGINTFIRITNKLIDGLNIVNPFSDIPQIPEIPVIELARGGVVPATPGGMLARIGEAGQAERVEPLDSDGLSQRDKAMIKYLTNSSGGGVGGTTINVYPAPGMNERELADLVSRRLASQMRSGGI